MQTSMAHYLVYFALAFLGALSYHRAIADGFNLSFWFVAAFLGLNFVTLVRLSYLTQPDWPLPADPIIDFIRPGWTAPADAIRGLISDLAVSFLLGAAVALLGALSGGILRLILHLGASAATFWRRAPTSS
jgi:hypothetical protein